MHHITKILCALVFTFAVGCSKTDAPAKSDTTPTAADKISETKDATAPAEKPHAKAGDAHADHDHEDGPCTCAKGKTGETIWCDACGVGYIAGAKVTDKAKVEAALASAAGAKPTADGDGHDAGPCLCPKGKAGETVWCDSCGVGYVAGKKVTDKAQVDAALAANAG